MYTEGNILEKNFYKPSIFCVLLYFKCSRRDPLLPFQFVHYYNRYTLCSGGFWVYGVLFPVISLDFIYVLVFLLIIFAGLYFTGSDDLTFNLPSRPYNHLFSSPVLIMTFL